MSRQTTPNKTLSISNINPQLRVTIISHKIEDDCVLYTVKLQDEQSNDNWIFDTRFSEISLLNNSIINSKQIPILELPKFPKKKLLWSNNKDPVQIIKRRKKLERFLNQVFTNDKILNLECVQTFMKRIKREFEIFEKHREFQGRRTINLEKNVEKHFLDEIDSNLSNSDFIDIMDKYEEYENQKEISPERTASNFLKTYNKEKKYKEFPGITLEKVQNEDEVIEKKVEKQVKIEDFFEETPVFREPVSSGTVKKSTAKSTGGINNNSNEKIKVVYMSPLLRIDRSESIKKQERMKMIQSTYPGKQSFFQTYFKGFCV